MRKCNAVSVVIVVAYVMAVVVHPQETTADEARAVKRGLSYVKQAGLKWMDGRGCVSRHQVPTMIWSHEAVLGKDNRRRTELNQWIDWSGEVMNFVKPQQKANVDANATMMVSCAWLTQLAVPQAIAWRDSLGLATCSECFERLEWQIGASSGFATPIFLTTRQHRGFQNQTSDVDATCREPQSTTLQENAVRSNLASHDFAELLLGLGFFVKSHHE